MQRQQPSPRRDLFINALRQAGRRITAQRRLVCDYLASTSSHPTPYRVYAELSAQHPEISRATVYNTLKVLHELGAILKIDVGADHAHYDTDTAPHINLICLRCHAVSDYPAPDALEDVWIGIGDAEGFHPLAVRMDVLGFCAACRARKKAEIREQWRAQHTSASSVPGVAEVAPEPMIALEPENAHSAA